MERKIRYTDLRDMARAFIQQDASNDAMAVQALGIAVYDAAMTYPVDSLARVNLFDTMRKLAHLQEQIELRSLEQSK